MVPHSVPATRVAQTETSGFGDTRPPSARAIPMPSYATRTSPSTSPSCLPSCSCLPFALAFPTSRLAACFPVLLLDPGSSILFYLSIPIHSLTLLFYFSIHFPILQFTTTRIVCNPQRLQQSSTLQPPVNLDCFQPHTYSPTPDLTCTHFNHQRSHCALSPKPARKLCNYCSLRLPMSFSH